MSYLKLEIQKVGMMANNRPSRMIREALLKAHRDPSAKTSWPRIAEQLNLPVETVKRLAGV